MPGVLRPTTQREAGPTTKGRGLSTSCLSRAGRQACTHTGARTHLPPALGKTARWPAPRPQTATLRGPAGQRPPTAPPPSPASRPLAAPAGAGRSSRTAWSCQTLHRGGGKAGEERGRKRGRSQPTTSLTGATPQLSLSWPLFENAPRPCWPEAATPRAALCCAHSPAALLVMRSSENACCSCSTL